MTSNLSDRFNGLISDSPFGISAESFQLSLENLD